MTLKDLEIGDKFVMVNDHRVVPLRYLVRGNSSFKGWGKASRVCQKLAAGTMVSKDCAGEVIKVGESRFKERMKLRPINEITFEME